MSRFFGGAVFGIAVAIGAAIVVSASIPFGCLYRGEMILPIVVGRTILMF